MPTDPLAPPPLPQVERLNRTVLLVAALIVMITLLVVAFLVSPRATPRTAAPAQPPPTAGAPGFLNRPPGNLPPSPRPPLTDQDYLRSLLEQAAPANQAPGAFGAPPGSFAPPPGLATAPPPSALPSPATPALPPTPPRDLRREEFLRALRAPLAEPLPPPALPRGILPEADGTYGLGASRSPAASSPAAGSPGAGASEPDESFSQAAGDQPPPLAAATRAAGAYERSGVSSASAATGATGAAGASGAAVGAMTVQPAPAWPAAPPAPLPPATTAALAPRPPRPAAASRVAASAANREPGDIAVAYHPAASGTTLAAGTLIPALLETEINSDLPGSLLAQVSRDVYDLRQRSVVVPRGTRLLGAYQNQVAVGQRRLLVAWTRLTFPDGSGFDLPGLPATDPSGAAGLTARVQNHLLRVFGDALLLSLLSAGADLSQPQNRNLSLAPSAGSVASAAVGQELANVGVQLLRRDLSIQPTLRLAAGTPFLVFVNGDLPLAPPVALIDRGRRP
jgi:type IV secretion system protein TrbI